MRQDALDAICLKSTSKVPRKERLNNYSLLNKYGNADPYTDLEQAYTRTVKGLGIDLISSVPKNSDARKMTPKEVFYENYNGIKLGVAYLGVMPTFQIRDYGFHEPKDVYAYDPMRQEYHGLWLETRSNNAATIRDAYMASYARNTRLAGDAFLTFPYFYTTLYMWGVETFGYELFMIAAMEDPEAYDQVLKGFMQRSRMHIDGMLKTGADVLVLHDDIAIASGPCFNPEWYRKYLFPKYIELLKPIKEQGKKVLFTSDGNIEMLLDDLIYCGFDGFEIECPATNLKNILNKCGKDKAVVGGMDNYILTFGTPNEIYAYVESVLTMGKEYPGYFISNTAGIHGNISLENLEAYNAAIERFRYRR